MIPEQLTPFVNRFLKTWQGRLGLKGWNISWVWLDEHSVNEVAGYDALAATTYDPASLNALIRVHQDIDWQVKSVAHNHYLPECLLHELVHIRVNIGEVLLQGVEAVIAPYIPAALLSSQHQAVVNTREAYVDTIVALLLDKEAAWK